MTALRRLLAFLHRSLFDRPVERTSNGLRIYRCGNFMWVDRDEAIAVNLPHFRKLPRVSPEHPLIIRD